MWCILCIFPSICKCNFQFLSFPKNHQRTTHYINKTPLFSLLHSKFNQPNHHPTKSTPNHPQINLPPPLYHHKPAHSPPNIPSSFPTHPQTNPYPHDSATGCKQPEAPLKGWVKVIGGEAVFSCNSTNHSWKLKCVAGSWQGANNNCSNEGIDLIINLVN